MFSLSSASLQSSTSFSFASASSAVAAMAVAEEEEEDGLLFPPCCSLECIASMRRGSLVILCMGSMRKDCMFRDWHTGEDSSSRRASTNLPFFSLEKKMH